MVYYVVSAGYNKVRNSIYIKLYNADTNKFRDWYDPSFKAYCLGETIDTFSEIPVSKLDTITKYDALNDKNVEVIKAEFDNPLLVKKTHSTESRPIEDERTFWENHVKFQMCYIYDKNIRMGMPYDIINDKLILHTDIDAEKRSSDLLKLFEEKTISAELIRLFEYPVPNLKRAALDIEVLNTGNAIPRPEVATNPVLCVCIKTENRRIGFLLLQPNKKLEDFPDVDELYFFTSEKEMLISVFEYIQKFPFLITFNGDGFDLMYLRNRATRFGIQNENIPIDLHGTVFTVNNALHIDLYRFFNVKAIQNYAFQGKYKDVDLDSLGKILIKKPKLKGPHQWVGDMNYKELIDYCMRDAEITYELTSFDDNLVMNLILVISRISRMPVEEVSRKAVGRWIGSFLYLKHRQLNYLLPRPKDIIEMKGRVASQALIKGKQYLGAIVIQPKGGTYFGAKVIDYGSLYPSIMKFYNIGYETVNCPHPECKSNHPCPKLPHWVCTKNKSMESQFIGSLRDMRLGWYKRRAKDKTLTKEQQSWYKCVEQTIKVFMNAAYGFFAQKGNSSIFACPPASELIANIGRDIISATADEAKELGIKTIAGDTDSLIIEDTNVELIKKLQDWAFTQYKIDLELDKSYRFMCFSSRKKNYLGVQPNGEVDVKGMVGKKRHTPEYFKKAFSETKSILSNVQKLEDIESAKTKIRKIVLDCYRRLKRREWTNLDDLAFHMQLGKKMEDYVKNIPQHVKAARQLEREGYVLEAGSIISFIKANNPDGVVPLELARNIDVDVKKYTEFLRSTFEQILEPLEIDFDEILGFKKMDAFCKVEGKV